MTYEKPEVRDFGSIAEHTYTAHCEDDFNGCSVLVDGQVIEL